MDPLGADRVEPLADDPVDPLGADRVDPLADDPVDPLGADRVDPLTNDHPVHVVGMLTGNDDISL